MNRLTTGAVAGIAVLAAGVPLSSASAAPAAAVRPAPGVAAEQSRVADAARALGLGPGQALVVRSTVTDPDGTVHVRYDRTFDGLRVVGGDLVVERSAAGVTRSVRWNAARSVAVASTSPRLSAAQASSRAGGATRSDLVVYAAKSGGRLAWDTVREGVKADQTPSRLHTVVDATTGATLDSWDEITPGTGSSMYSGTVSLGTTLSGGSYLLKDSVGNYTTDLNGATTGTGTQFTDADDAWGNGSVSSRQTAAVDAHYGAEKTFDYYKNVLGRNGIWDDGTGARSRVHYGNAYVNAFWDGTQMTYGDGANNAKPLTAIDVAGHEMSHGVTENTAGLVYRGDAGGLNEATSDIFGTAVEWYANSSADPGDYLIGEKIDINGNGTPLRYMDKPSRDGRSQDCWTTSTRNLDPHYSSGPLNHWFFMASEGSGAKTVNGVAYNSPTCGGAPAVTGAGRAAVEKVWYRTLSTKLTSRSDYKAAREGAIASAKELYGAGSPTCVAVKSAFDAIAVPAGSQTC
ncbi:M4 family metallopeptidase [Phycicoccus sp. 3266]|uniref:M4 family metallopeptidase n=1 Tax=Phycicoccus sp. 3266 TaxID=2817751 RepID=UPI0028605E6C|nr:M4 family metallopeptidase [Phycicoccus sp. 3266]MDR6862463.1 Zn-dependent metalloprotease [Phycicoccus sp. 3266]